MGTWFRSSKASHPPACTILNTLRWESNTTVHTQIIPLRLGCSNTTTSERLTDTMTTRYVWVSGAEGTQGANETGGTCALTTGSVIVVRTYGTAIGAGVAIAVGWTTSSALDVPIRLVAFHGCDGGKAIVPLTCLVLLLSPPCMQEDHGGAISLRRVKASGMEFVAVVKKCAARSRSYVFSAVIDFESFERWSEGPVQLSLILLPPRKSSRGPRQFSEGLGVFGDRGAG